VVPIEDENITRKIHSTWRLQYLKDVVLARILDDPTFGVLNSLIFFNQVEIVSHLQQNTPFLKELFSLIDGKDTSPGKRRDAVCFIQQCCSIAKNLQPPARQALYGNFIQNGLLNVIVFALSQQEAPIRIAGTDILVAMIDHDPAMVRSQIFKAIAEKRTPLTDTLINLLLVENDLGVKAQAADAIKVLLDPQQAPPEGMARIGEQFLSKYRGTNAISQQTESFIQDFYENGAKKLFQPLKDLEKRDSVRNLTFNEVSLYGHLVEILMYFVRQHLYRSKFFIASESITARVGQLLGSSQKHMKLSKYFYSLLLTLSLNNNSCFEILSYITRLTR
jgi:protein phosphatase 4 regulatory subunit 3